MSYYYKTSFINILNRCINDHNNRSPDNIYVILLHVLYANKHTKIYYMKILLYK